MGVLPSFTKIMRALTKTKKKEKISGPDHSQLGDTSSSTVSGWACLPTDLLNLVLDHITDFSDFIHFCAVCQLWRFVALQPPQLGSHSQRLRCQHQQNFHFLKTCRNQLPFLLMCSPRDDSQDQHKQNAFSVTHGTIYDIHLPIPYSLSFFGHKKTLVGSTRGWLFVVDPSYLVITLINPFLNKMFSLPELPADGIFVINQAKLLSEPDKSDYYEVLVKWNSVNLAYFTSKTQVWIGVGQFPENPIQNRSFDCFKDTISYKGQIYSISQCGNHLTNLDFDRRIVTVVASVKNVFSHIFIRSPTSVSLVESQEGDLLLVRRHKQCSPMQTIEVYKLSYSRGRGGEQGHSKLVKMITIGKQALFIGDYGESISVSTRDFPMCKSNCIYYYDRYFRLPDTSKRGKEYAAYPYSLSDDSVSKIWTVPYFKPDSKCFTSTTSVIK